MLPVIVDGIVSIVESVFKSFLPETPDQKLEEIKVAIQAKLADDELLKKQLDVDAVEAASTSLFVSGWRPLAGWVCTLGLAYNTIILALIKSLFAIAALIVDPHTVAIAQSLLPQIDMTLLGNILAQMLGMTAFAGLRTYEKQNSLTNIH